MAIFEGKVNTEGKDGRHLVLIDGGESGKYTYNEFALLTTYMDFTTATRLADKVEHVIENKKTSKFITQHDIIEAQNSSIITEDPSDRKIKLQLLNSLERLTSNGAVIATGNLGPPSITRDLILAYLVTRYGTIDEKEFLKHQASDKAYAATLSYIRDTKPGLYKFLRSECNYKNYQHLSKFNEPGLKPHELVKQKIENYI